MVAETSKRTLAHYETNADSFWEGTAGHDVSQNIEALLSSIEGQPPFRILDFGCGPGRDLLTFKQMGHLPTGLDGCKRFVEMAQAHSGCPVLHQDFLSLDLPQQYFDGVFANASFFHVPSDQHQRVLTLLHACLKPRGVLFFSNPRGNAVETYHGERYGCHFDLPQWREILTQAGFDEVLHYYRPQGRPIEEQPWLAMVWRRPLFSISVRSKAAPSGPQEVHS